MKTCHNILISVFEKNLRNQEKTEQTLKALIPLDFEKEKISITKENATGMEGSRITICKVFLEKQRHLKAFLEQLKENLGKEQCIKLVDQKLSRLDEHLHLFIRLDKPSLEKGSYVLTDTGDCYHLRLSMAAYPKSMTKGLELVETLFS